ncbi:hypothetical protein K438DRAFT_1506058, partial [Mycena galopus ATCC 62051]
YKHWDPVCANIMVSAVFDFVGGNVMERRKEILTMEISFTAPNWPTYFRMKTGLAPGFSGGNFPKHAHPDISSYIQVLPDIDAYMCLANDILSFYKEGLAGETTDYVRVRSKATLKSVGHVLVEMVREVGELHARIPATLSGHPAALAAWETFEHGYIAYHLTLGRYKLSEL